MARQQLLRSDDPDKKEQGNSEESIRARVASALQMRLLDSTAHSEGGLVAICVTICGASHFDTRLHPNSSDAQDHHAVLRMVSGVGFRAQACLTRLTDCRLSYERMVLAKCTTNCQRCLRVSWCAITPDGSSTLVWMSCCTARRCATADEGELKCQRQQLSRGKNAAIQGLLTTRLTSCRTDTLSPPAHASFSRKL